MKTKPTKKKKPSQVVSVRIPADLHRVITFMAEEEGRSFGAMIRLLINEGFYRNEGKGSWASPYTVRECIEAELRDYRHPKQLAKMLQK